jgi:hypothetical protein
MSTEAYLEERARALLCRLLPTFDAHPISQAIPHTAERSVKVNLPTAVTGCEYRTASTLEAGWRSVVYEVEFQGADNFRK